jgi:putative ABC transport system permease protein
MLRIALATLRFRWVSFAGSALALILGSAISAVMIPTLAAAAADHEPKGGTGQLSSAQAMAGTTTLLGVAVAVFVVSATFALATDQRRREVGLLRLVGAAPRQVRRMIMLEAAAVGLLASAAGCVLGALAIPLLRSWMIGHGVAPAWFTVPVSAPPLIIAFGVGLAAALAGATAASWGTSRVRPGEALRAAAATQRVMTLPRWVLGIALLAAGACAERAIIAGNPGNAMIVKDDMPAIIAIVTGCALLAPVLLRPVAGTAAILLARAGAGSMVISQNVLWAGRRTAATAAPVVLALGLALSMLAFEATADSASQLPGAQRISPHDQAQNGQATAVILGIALTYCILAIANTMVIAASARKREIAALSLAGATRRQVLGLITAESALTVLIAAITAAAAGVAVIACQHAALARLSPAAPIAVPWLRIGEIAAACLAAAVIASALSAAKALREWPTGLIQRLRIKIFIMSGQVWLLPARPSPRSLARARSAGFARDHGFDLDLVSAAEPGHMQRPAAL